LADVPPEAIEALSNASLLKNYRPGQLIFQKGDRAVGFYLVAEGAARVFLSDPSGKERVLKIAKTGEPFGEAALFQADGYPASAMAVGPLRAFFLPKESILRLIAAHPRLALATIGVLASRLSHLTFLLESSLKETLPRLVSYLLSLPETDGVVALPMLKVELARHLGITPESLSRAFGSLKAQGLIQEKKPHFIAVVKRSLLEELKDSE
jgi:CRP/FNR family transcriptional regulator